MQRIGIIDDLLFQQEHRIDEPIKIGLDSVSVGSIISASGTISGKYIVGGWIPSSINPLAISMAETP